MNKPKVCGADCECKKCSLGLILTTLGTPGLTAIIGLILKVAGIPGLMAFLLILIVADKGGLLQHK